MSRTLNRREYGEFKQMLLKALSEVRLPAGTVDSSSIIPGSIRPQHCVMSANWNFSGTVMSNGIPLGSSGKNLIETQKEPNQENRNIAEIQGKRSCSNYPNVDIFFLNAQQQDTTLLLPLAKPNSGRKLYIKRVDKVVGNICRVLATGNDKVDGTDGVELQSTQAVILIPSSSQWHVFSKLD